MQFPEEVRHNNSIGHFAKLVWYELCVMAYPYDHVTTTARHIASMFEVNDQRTFAVALVLYAAQKLYLKKEKLISLSERFGKLREINDIISIYEMIINEETMEANRFPLVDVNEIRRLFSLYLSNSSFKSGTGGQ